MSDSDEPTPTPPTPTPRTPATPTPPSRPVDPRRTSRSRDREQNVFERFFPGPSTDDPRVQARIDALTQAAERRAERERQRHSHPRTPREQPGTETRGGTQKGGTRRGADGGATGTTSESPAAPVAPSLTAEDLEKVIDALHEQTDVIRSLLDADIAIRDDARATAQNSRTFAIAGIAIAFLTLVGTGVTVVVAFMP